MLTKLDTLSISRHSQILETFKCENLRILELMNTIFLLSSNSIPQMKAKSKAYHFYLT